eukprot:216290-Prorocentrum_lima.AAC.1
MDAMLKRVEGKASSLPVCLEGMKLPLHTKPSNRSEAQGNVEHLNCMESIWLEPPVGKTH